MPVDPVTRPPISTEEVGEQIDAALREVLGELFAFASLDEVVTTLRHIFARSIMSAASDTDEWYWALKARRQASEKSRATYPLPHLRVERPQDYLSPEPLVEPPPGEHVSTMASLQSEAQRAGSAVQTLLEEADYVRRHRAGY